MKSNLLKPQTSVSKKSLRRREWSRQGYLGVFGLRGVSGGSQGYTGAPRTPSGATGDVWADNGRGRVERFGLKNSSKRMSKTSIKIGK